jgi:hypothetical protein
MPAGFGTFGRNFPRLPSLRSVSQAVGLAAVDPGSQPTWAKRVYGGDVERVFRLTQPTITHWAVSRYPRNSWPAWCSAATPNYPRAEVLVDVRR